MDRFVPSYSGYGSVLRGKEVASVCARAAASAASSANSRGGKRASYVTDVQVGVKRVHARVSTKRGDSGSFHSERKTGVLRSVRPRI